MTNTQSKIYWKIFDVINSSRLPYHLLGTDRVIGFAERYLTPEQISSLRDRRAFMKAAIDKVNNIVNQ
jgi:hypothetical protein